MQRLPAGSGREEILDAPAYCGADGDRTAARYVPPRTTTPRAPATPRRRARPPPAGARLRGDAERRAGARPGRPGVQGRGQLDPDPVRAGHERRAPGEG